MPGDVLKEESGTDSETCGQSCRERKVRKMICLKIAEGSGDMWAGGDSEGERTVMLMGSP
jgi:hypothetical protein